MIIRLTCLTTALSLAAASKSAKTPRTPTPTDASKAAKSTSPIASKSSKSKTGDEYFIAPFSCPQKCIDAHGYELESHLLEDAVSECDASDSYQKWKVHRVGGFLKFESAAKYDHNMCLAVVHQDSDHESNKVGAGGDYIDFFFQGSAEEENLGNGLVDPYNQYPAYSFFTSSSQSWTFGVVPDTGSSNLWVYSENNVGNGDTNALLNGAAAILFSENEVDGICNDGKLGLAHCSHPGSNWYNTGGNFLSAFCWNHDTPTAMSVEEDCTNLRVLNTTNTGDLTTSETFMILGSQ